MRQSERLAEYLLISERFEARGSKISSLQDRKDRDELFVIYYVANGGNATQAAIDCGVSKASAGTVGNRLKQRLGAEIDKQIDVELKTFTPRALYFVRKLCEEADSPHVQLRACIDLLDRAGLKAPTKTEITKVHQFDIEKARDEEHDSRTEEYLTLTGDETEQMREYKINMRAIREKGTYKKR